MPVNLSGGTIEFNTEDILELSDIRYVNEKGDTMKGNLDLGGNKIINVREEENLTSGDIVTFGNLKKELFKSELTLSTMFSNLITKKISEVEKAQLALSYKTRKLELSTYQFVHKKYVSFMINVVENKVIKVISDIEKLTSETSKTLPIVQNLIKDAIAQIEIKIGGAETKLLELHDRFVKNPKYITDIIEKYESDKKDKYKKLVNQKYYEFAGKRDYSLDIIPLFKDQKSEVKSVQYYSLIHAIHFKNGRTEFKKSIEGEFTFFLVVKCLTSSPKTIISGNRVNGFDYRLIINNKTIFQTKYDDKIHIYALMNLNFTHAIYYNEDLIQKTFDLKTFDIKEKFIWGKLEVGTTGEAYVYDFVIYDRKMSTIDIKAIINVLAKFHSVPQKIIDIEDRLLKIESEIDIFKKIYKHETISLESFD